MVSNAQNALHEVKKKLYDSFKIRIVKEWWIDQNRKVIIQEEKGQKFFVLFKREFFHSYKKITGEEGEGETINVADFEYAVYEQDIKDFFYVYQNNAIYKIRHLEINKHKRYYLNESDGREQYLFNNNLLQRIC
jgi:hypothetical protein